ncbi:MAG: CBS domain-containing protein [Clostridia bacterium]|nr:CBS domain-containing protein [Clostridia bacterium]MBR2221319.1 CBS domain-containing protein [Clostridia bacterium]MBR3790340.1 CBS domain-containing protein [Clostridia bacterium]
MKTKEPISNAKRFVIAYNTIDQALRQRHNIRRSLSFSDMIRKTVVVDYIVRKYEDQLIDYGRLRNAIIHNSNDDFLIAEPHTEVVEEFEKIAALVSAPPKVIDTVCTKDVLTVEHSARLYDVIKLIYSSTYSNLPVYKNGGVIGVVNGQKLLDFIGKAISQGEDIDNFLKSTTAEKFVKTQIADTKYFEVCDINLTVEKALNMFYHNRKLLIIILTNDGMLQEAPLGILTPTDIMDLNKVIE